MMSAVLHGHFSLLKFKGDCRCFRKTWNLPLTVVQAI
jgi:hypothetical protein